MGDAAKSSDIFDPATGVLRVINQIRCFTADTLIATPSGSRPIAEIRQGELVRAFNFETGQWVDRRVAAFHENLYEGPLVTIATDAGVVRTTVYHPFWVVSGRDLEERSTPRELAIDEDQGLSLSGRWVNSHELRAGDALIGTDGQLRTVLKIEQEFHSNLPVYNLTIDDNHTFAVGPDAILVHNTADCELHHSDPIFMGGDPKQNLTELSFARHRGKGESLHNDLNNFLRQQADEFGNHMRPQRGNSAADIAEAFSREERLNAMARFYKAFQLRYPEVARDFFNQHPGLE